MKGDENDWVTSKIFFYRTIKLISIKLAKSRLNFVQIKDQVYFYVKIKRNSENTFIPSKFFSGEGQGQN